MELFKRKGKEIVRAEDIYPNEEEAQEFLRTGFERSQKNKHNLYQLGLFESKNKIVSSISQHEISYIDKEVTLNLLSREAINELSKTNYNQIHIGTILIGLAGLTRAQVGTKTFVYIYDDRWDNHQQAAIATAEVDLSTNLAVIGCIPNYVMTTREFSKYIKVCIRTKNYNMKGEYKNLLVNLMYVGKVSDKFNHKCNIEFNNLVQTFGSKHVNMIEAKPVDNSFLEGTEWTLPNLQTARNKQPERAQIYENSLGQATVRFSNYKQINNLDDLESEAEINMVFDDLEINILEHNFDSIVDKLIDDIDHLDEEQYLEKYKTYDLGLHRLSDDEMKQLILKIGLEHILGEKEYNSMIIEEECLPAEEQYSYTPHPHTSGMSQEESRTDQQGIKQTQEMYKEKPPEQDRSFHIELTRPGKNRIPYNGIEQVSLAGNILNLDNVDPQDWEKVIERWEKGCIHAAIM